MLRVRCFDDPRGLAGVVRQKNENVDAASSNSLTWRNWTSSSPSADRVTTAPPSAWARA